MAHNDKPRKISNIVRLSLLAGLVLLAVFTCHKPSPVVHQIPKIVVPPAAVVAPQLVTSPLPEAKTAPKPKINHIFKLGPDSESHNFTIYDTTLTLGGVAWEARISRPVNLFVANNPDTASRPMIIMMPGQGQMGSANTAFLTTYGPHYWEANGWDGSVPMGNGVHYPILITITPTATITPNPSSTYLVDSFFRVRYKARAKSCYVTGLSEGAFNQGGIIEFENTLGDQAGMKIINAVMLFEGTPVTPSNEFPSRSQDCSGSWCDTNYYKTWDKKYGGRFFYLEGSGSDNFRDGWHYATAMNDTTVNSAYFSYESDGGGAHCCWNDFYNPSVTNWTTGSSFGTYTSSSELGPDQQGNYRNGTNVYQWLLEQGDSTCINCGNPPPTVSAGSNQTISLPTNSVTLAGSATANSPATLISSYLWSQTFGPNTGTFSNTTITNPTFSGLIAGSYILQLQATDNDGNINTANVTITVNSGPYLNPCSVYYWDSTNVNILINNAAYPSIHPCDTIYVDPCSTQAGYRSVTIKLGSTTPWLYSTQDSNMINIIARNAAAYGTIKTSTSNEFANGIDSSNNLVIKGFKMYDHVDPLFSTVTQTGYLHHIKFLNDTLQNMGGIWNSGPISTPLPNYTGGADTTNCNYDIRFHQCIFDSIGNTSFGGLTIMWLGGFNQNQVFVKTEIDSCLFNYAPSPSGSGPACFIHAQQCFFIKIHDNTFSNLGVVSVPSGHAANIFMQLSTFDVHHNFFEGDFGNCVRAISQVSTPGLTALETVWDPTYDGVSRFWGNILDHGRKYPMIEDQKDTIGANSLPYVVPRRSARVWNNTMNRGGVGIGDGPYNVSVYDWYEVAYTSDTVEMHNNMEVGPPTDTTSGAFCYSTYCYSLFTHPNGTAATLYDTTGGNYFFQTMTYATSGLADTSISPVKFYPLFNNVLYNEGVTVPSWLTKDFHGNPVPATGRASFGLNHGVDIGAVQYQAGGPPPPFYMIKSHFGKFVLRQAP